MRPSGKLLRGLALAAVAAVYIFLVWRLVAPYTPIDDAFIGFRYARHLASGHGLAFNLNEPAVEGYSSLAWVLILAAGARLGIGLAALSQILGLLLGASTLLVLGRRSVLAAAGLAVCLPWLYHTLNGLETCLATFLIAALTCLPPDTPRSPLRTSAGLLAAALLTVTRPEGLMFVLVWAAAVHLADRRLHRHEIRLALAALAAFAAQLVFRLAVHGDWIANSARAKVLPLGFTLGPGLMDLWFFLLFGVGGGLLLLLAAAGAWLSIRSDRSVRSEDAGRQTLARVLFLALSGCALAASGGDSFPLWRFFVPLAPVLFLSAAEGLEALLALRPLSERTAALLRGLAAVTVLAALIFPWRHEGFLPAIRREGYWVWHWKRLGLRLAATLPPDTTIALCPVGALPYRSGFRTLDMLGLNDPHIARVKPDFSYYYPGHHRHDGPWILSQRPDLILLANGPVAADPAAPFPWEQMQPYELDLVKDPRFAAEYELARIPLGDGTWLLTFLRKSGVRRPAT